MAQAPTDNSLIWNAKSWDDLSRLASLEQAGDLLLMIRKFAHTASLGANTKEDVWGYGGTKTILSTAYTMDVVSDNAADTSEGTGGRVLLIDGVDANYDILQEVVLLNGVTSVETTGEFLAINNLRIVSSGSGMTNAGTITVTDSNGSSIQGSIEPAHGLSHMSHFTVPNGYTAFTTTTKATVYRASGSGVKEAEFEQMVYVPSINTKYSTITHGIYSGGSLDGSPNTPSQTPAHATLWYRATASSNNTVVSSMQEIILIKGDYNLRTEV